MRKRTLESLICVLCLVASTFAEPHGDFVGLWWVSHGDGAPLQVRLYPDGSAWSDYPSNNPGRWSLEGDGAVCLWADGWKETFVKIDSLWVKRGFKPSATLSGPPSNTSRAYRVSTRADGWFGAASNL